eukprot:scaffold7763_cov46-Phaeocystis_antarctica.AAC.5
MGLQQECWSRFNTPSPFIVNTCDLRRSPTSCAPGVTKWACSSSPTDSPCSRRSRRTCESVCSSCAATCPPKLTRTSRGLHGTYRLRVPAACVAYVPDAQGSGCVPTRRACRTYVPRTVVPQVSATDVLTELHLTEKVAKKLVEKFPEDAHLKPQVAKMHQPCTRARAR